jgi:hypothetical protein
MHAWGACDGGFNSHCPENKRALPFKKDNLEKILVGAEVLGLDLAIILSRSLRKLLSRKLPLAGPNFILEDWHSLSIL